MVVGTLIEDNVAYVSTDHALRPSGTQYAARHLCSRCGTGGVAEFQSRDAYPIGRTRPAADLVENRCSEQSAKPDGPWPHKGPHALGRTPISAYWRAVGSCSTMPPLSIGRG